jgi:hypothetical protein
MGGSNARVAQGMDVLKDWFSKGERYQGTKGGGGDIAKE